MRHERADSNTAHVRAFSAHVRSGYDVQVLLVPLKVHVVGDERHPLLQLDAGVTDLLQPHDSRLAAVEARFDVGNGCLDGGDCERDQHVDFADADVQIADRISVTG